MPKNFLKKDAGLLKIGPVEASHAGAGRVPTESSDLSQMEICILYADLLL